MSNTFNTALEAKVAGQNQAHELANKLVPNIIETLKPLVGKKCFNQGGVISQKLKKILPELPEMCHYSTGHGYSLNVEFRVVTTYPAHLTNYGHVANYTDVNVYLAEIDDLTVNRINNFQPLKTDYTTAEIIKAREELKVASDRVREIERKLSLFGSYDR